MNNKLVTHNNVCIATSPPPYIPEVAPPPFKEMSTFPEAVP